MQWDAAAVEEAIEVLTKKALTCHPVSGHPVGADAELIVRTTVRLVVADMALLSEDVLRLEHYREDPQQ